MSSDFPVTIFHNPSCGTSRTVLATIRAAGHEPEVVEYLKVGWTPGRLAGLLAAMDAAPRDILREKEAREIAPDLLASGATDDQILDAMVAHPILVNRPIVATPEGTRLCRPADVVLGLLSRQPRGDAATA